MSKKKARYIVLLAAVLIAVMAFSFFVMAGNELTIWYEVDGQNFKTTAATLQKVGPVEPEEDWHYLLETNIINEVPQKPGYTFTGWAANWTGFEGPYVAGNNVTLLDVLREDSDLTFEELQVSGEIYSNTLIFTAQFTANKHKVSLYDGENLHIAYANQTFGEVVNGADGLPALTKLNHVFIGWKDDDNLIYGLNNADPPKIFYTLNKDADVALRAVWVEVTDETINTVTFKDEDTGLVFSPVFAGKPGDAQKQAPSIPNGTKPGYVFTGKWINDADNSQTLNAGQYFGFEESKVYFAEWQAIPYTISESVENVTITGLPIPNTRTVGQTVTFTAAPAEDMVIESVKVTNQSTGTSVPLTDNGDGTYSFVMPAADVKITAKAVQGVYTISTNGGSGVNIEAPDKGTVGAYVTFDVTPTPADNNIDSVYVRINGNGPYVPVTFISSTGNTNKYGFTMPANNVTIFGSSQAEKFTVTLLDWRGIILKQESVSGGESFDIGAETGHVETRAGYTFEGWYTNLGVLFADKNATSVTINGNVIIRATYKALQQDIYKAADSSSHVDIFGVASKNSDGNPTSADLRSGDPVTNHCVSATGQDATVTVKPEFNYQITGVAVRPKDDSSNTAIPMTLRSFNETSGEYSYSFVMPAEDVVIAVYTKPVPYRVFVEETVLPEGGTYTINGFYSDNLAVKQGEDATINIMPKPGYEVSRIVAKYTDPVGLGDAYKYNTIMGDPIVNSFTFTMPPANVQVEIQYAKIDYNIDTATSNGQTNPNSAGVPEGYVETSFEGSLTNTANVGDLINLEVHPSYGYNLKALTVRLVEGGQPGKMININVGDKDNEYEFTMPASDVIVTATFVEKIYNVTFRDWNNVMLDQQSIDYLKNPTEFPEISGRAGYTFLGWISDDTQTPVTVPSNELTDFVIVKNTRITAVYEPTIFNITYTVGANGEVVEPKPETAAFESNVTFEVRPATGYMIDTVTAYYTDAYGQPTQLTRFNEEPDKVTGGDYKFRMPLSDVEIFVTFKEIVYNVDLYKVEGEGDVYLNGYDRDNMTAKYLETVTITAFPDPGWILQSIVVTEGAENGPELALTPATFNPAGGAYQFTMPDDNVFISVTFVQDTYTVSFDPVENGLVNGSLTPVDVEVPYQTLTSFNVVPDPGYQIASVVATYTDTNGIEQTVSFKDTPDNIITGGDYTFTMPAADVKVKVLFEVITYDVTLDSNGNSEIYLNDKIQTATRAPYLSTVTLNITPKKDGWILAELYVKGDDSGDSYALDQTEIAASGGTYTFTMPKENVTVYVRTVQKGFNVTYTPPATGTGTVSGDTAANYQDTVEFTATPASGYMIDSAVATFKDVNGQGQTITFDSVPSDLVTGGDYTFTMPDANVVVTVTFKKVTYNVTLTTSGNAGILLNDTHEVSTTADYNSTVTLAITPDEGWLLDSISASNGNDVYAVTPVVSPEGGTYSFTMPANDVAVHVKLVKMNSSIDTFTISFTGPDHGTVSVRTEASLDAKNADFGDIVTVVCDPDEGYRFKSLSIKNKEDGSFISPAFVSANEEYVHTYSFKMPASDVEITAAFEHYSSTRYDDVRTDHWAYVAVEFVSDRGYFLGTTESLFSPNKTMTRGMFVTVLGRMAEVDTSLYATSTFNDVNMKAYYGPYVEWAAQEGIVLGYGNNKFGPEDNVTREQMAQIMYNYAAWAGFSVEQKNAEWMDRYPDTNKISNYAQDAVKWAVGAGIMNGKKTEKGTLLSPLEFATRAHVAQIIQNFSDKVTNR